MRPLTGALCAVLAAIMAAAASQPLLEFSRGEELTSLSGYGLLYPAGKRVEVSLTLTPATIRGVLLCTRTKWPLQGLAVPRTEVRAFGNSSVFGKIVFDVGETRANAKPALAAFEQPQ